jgi:hypothetical protein
MATAHPALERALTLVLVNPSDLPGRRIPDDLNARETLDRFHRVRYN